MVKKPNEIRTLHELRGGSGQSGIYWAAIRTRSTIDLGYMKTPSAVLIGPCLMLRP